jgi:hypothetical protein
LDRSDSSESGAKKEVREKGCKMQSTRLLGFGPRIFVILGAMILALSMASAASADTITKHITFDLEVVIGGSKLAPGEYTLVIADGHLTVKREKKIVAQATAHWETRDNPPAHDSFLYGDNNQVVEIRFAHQSAVLVLAAP